MWMIFLVITVFLVWYRWKEAEKLYVLSEQKKSLRQKLSPCAERIYAKEAVFWYGRWEVFMKKTRKRLHSLHFTRPFVKNFRATC